MGGVTQARYGGAGFAIKEPGTVVEAKSSQRNDVKGLARDDPRLPALLSALRRLSELTRSTATVTVTQAPAAHLGLGSTTSLALASITAASAACGLTLAAAQIQVVSGRGGASGVGVNTFFCGGFVVDGGHPFDKDGEQRPSDFRQGFGVPRVRVALVVPGDWAFYLVQPAGRLWNLEAEEGFFAENTPIPREEVLEVIALVYHGLVPAVEAADLKSVSQVIRELQETGFKKREIGGQLGGVGAAIEALRRRNIGAVGMSSMGPLVYVVAEESAAAEKQIKAACDEAGARYLLKTNGAAGHRLLA